jgi:hypothetical protein
MKSPVDNLKIGIDHPSARGLFASHLEPWLHYSTDPYALGGLVNIDLDWAPREGYCVPQISGSWRIVLKVLP